MIVKNEERNLPRCLRSVQGVVDEIIVVDTGSTDGTVRVAEEFGARVLHHAWNDDFAGARNVGLDVATGEWVLVLDADEELHQDDRHLLKEVCRNAAVEAYSMLHVNLMDTGGALDAENSYDVTLWRHRPEYRYQGKLHEQIVTAIWAINPGCRVDYCQIRVVHYGYLSEAVRSQNKSERNLRLIRKLVAEHPDDVFHRFNLGLELQRIQDVEGAVAEFERVRRSLTWYPHWAAKLFKCLASCLIVQESWECADEVLRHGLTVFPGFTDLVFLQGLIAQKQGRYARAVACFHQCIAMGPATESGAWKGMAGHRAYEALAQCYALLDRVEEAAEAYAAAFAAQPNWTGPLCGIARVLSGRLPDEELCRRLIAYFDPSLAADRVRLADVLLAGGRPDLALAVLDRELVDEDGAARFLYGLALLWLGRYAAAEAALEPPAAGTDRMADACWLASCACGRGREALRAALGRRRASAGELVEAARICLKVSEFWKEVGLNRPPRCPWEAALNEQEVES